jgi:hypothetical protein
MLLRVRKYLINRGNTQMKNKEEINLSELCRTLGDKYEVNGKWYHHLRVLLEYLPIDQAIVLVVTKANEDN